MNNEDLSTLVSLYISELSAGSGRLTHELISEIADPAIQQLLTAILIFHQDLTFERERLAETSAALREANEKLALRNQNLQDEVKERTLSLEEGGRDLQRSHAEVEKWCHAYDNSTVPMAIIARDDQTLRSLNPAWCNLLQSKLGDKLQATRVHRLPADSDSVPRANDASQGNADDVLECDVVAEDGRTIRVLLNRTELPPRADSPPEDFVTLLDIRSRIDRERELEIFRNIAEAMPVGLLLARRGDPKVRGDFAFTWANLAASEISQVSRSELGSRTILRDYPDLLETSAPDVYEDALRSSEARDLPSLRYDGALQERAIYDVRAVPVGGDGDTLAILYTDVTTRQDNLERLEILNGELATSNRNLDHFATAASHDLKEPVRTIQNYCELLADTLGEIDAEAAEYMKFIQDGALRMQELVQGLLRYSSVSRSNPVFQLVDLDEQARIVESDLALMATEKNAKVQIDALPLATGDSSQLRQVLQNLVANAIKYNENDSPLIHVGAANHNDHVEIFVEDNGKGIPEQHRERAFGMFSRLHHRGVSGSGIGLALCHDIISRHHGKIWIEDSEFGGAKLCFTLTHRQGTAA